MTNLLLFSYQDTQFTNVLLWIALLLSLVISIVLVFYQRKKGRELSYDLSLLDQVKKSNIESEFVLKAMRLSTWHIDPKTFVVTFDNDFRGQGNEWKPEEDGSDVQGSTNMLDERDAARVYKSIEEICQGRTDTYHEEYRVKITGTNTTYWEESFATVAERDIDGNPVSIVGTSMRIDERKAMEAALIEAKYKAEESDRLKTAFLANISHEIRTPLNAIVGFTSLLPDLQNAEERQSILDLIQENTQKLLRIVDDVVSISKVEAGKEELMLTTFDLPIMLKAVVDQYMPQLNKGVTMTTSFPQSSLSITSDRNRMQETMRHLVSNAVKFTDRGEVTVGFDTPVKGKIKLWVRDTGKGIAPEYHERIFERFFKVDEFIPGAGLGLTTCRTMAYSMGGNVKVDSQLGQGATFTFEVPFADVDAIPGKNEYE
ncbi:sensor histidine kinase [Prevotella sp. E13-27]|uniref:PAS domain-containing sensor histidine kinase n=1 Tax=Prevotella sp. E13-27 TaxID=2938122 RepID=UPI00200AD523|nr:HAMP domain-containing sensor histidine kinase [Prevotella sp. E13-27]MCK8622407.1 ATP-binding protein [Prevotella sp. E13-27]